MSNPRFVTAFQSCALTGSGPLESLLAAYSSGADRHRRRLANVAALERKPS
jgi:hypothetical protein